MGGKIPLATLLKPQRCRIILINCLAFGSNTDRNDIFTGLGFRDWQKATGLKRGILVSRSES
jgi:hypothetical protein